VYPSGCRHTSSKRDWISDVCSSDLLWGCQGWVPTRDGNPAFIAGRQVIGPDGAGDERAQAGLTADDFPNLDDFGVIDEDMSIERSEERRVGWGWKWGGCEDRVRAEG